MSEDKKEEKQPTNLKQFCRPLAFLSLFFAFALILYVIFAPTSPANVVGGKIKNIKKHKIISRSGMRGGCGCDTPGYGGRFAT